MQKRGAFVNFLVTSIEALERRVEALEARPQTAPPVVMPVVPERFPPDPFFDVPSGPTV